MGDHARVKRGAVVGSKGGILPGKIIREGLAAAGAGAQFTLSVRSGRTQHLINTVQGSAPAGSGRVTLRPTALGGRFDVQGTAADGTTLQVTIECARFGGMYAEGG